MPERDYYLGFSACSGIGPVSLAKLLNVFGSAKNAWEAKSSEVTPVLGTVKTQKFISFRDSFSISDYQRILKEKNVSFLTPVDKDYPDRLKVLPNPPITLYVRGNFKLNHDQRSIAIVGTRRVTGYGTAVTRLFTEALVQNGYCIISGLALGVDAISHATTLEAGGKTIAVLGCGVDCCYPAENQAIYDQIISSGGAIVSEVPIGQKPTKGLFPARNRIVAGLADAVLVTEGTSDSGSLITAEIAKKLGKPVYSIPGPITSTLSAGTNRLIREGSIMVTSPEEIIDKSQISSSLPADATHRALQAGKSQKIEMRKDLKPEEQKIVEALANESLQMDDIARNTKMSISQVSSVVTILELKNIIHQLSGGYYGIVSN